MPSCSLHVYSEQDIMYAADTTFWTFGGGGAAPTYDIFQISLLNLVFLSMCIFIKPIKITC